MKFKDFLNEATTVVNWTRTNRKEITKEKFEEMKAEIKDDATSAGHKIGMHTWYSDKEKINGTQFYSKHSKLNSVESQFHKDTDQRKYFVFE